MGLGPALKLGLNNEHSWGSQEGSVLEGLGLGGVRLKAQDHSPTRKKPVSFSPTTGDLSQFTAKHLRYGIFSYSYMLVATVSDAGYLHQSALGCVMLILFLPEPKRNIL